MMAHLHTTLQDAQTTGFCGKKLVFAAMAVEMHAGDKQDNIRAPMDEEMVAEGDRTLVDSGLTREELEEELQMGGRAEKKLP